MKKRLPYIISFISLLAVEVLIALFVDDSFIRPYLGDVIVVWVVYSFVQIILGGRFSSCIVSVGVFLFAVLVELMQAVNIVDLLHLQGSPFFRTLIGTHFDFRDILCYAAGTAVMISVILLKRFCNKKSDNLSG